MQPVGNVNTCLCLSHHTMLTDGLMMTGSPQVSPASSDATDGVHGVCARNQAVNGVTCKRTHHVTESFVCVVMYNDRHGMAKFLAVCCH